MENKKYLDKILKHILNNTKIDHEGEELYVPFTNHSFGMFFPSLFRKYYHFYKYCEKQFGLTEEEIDYVWDQWEEIILNKINNGQ